MELPDGTVVKINIPVKVYDMWQDYTYAHSRNGTMIRSISFNETMITLNHRYGKVFRSYDVGSRDRLRTIYVIELYRSIDAHGNLIGCINETWHYERDWLIPLSSVNNIDLLSLLSR